MKCIACFLCFLQLGFCVVTDTQNFYVEPYSISERLYFISLKISNNFEFKKRKILKRIRIASFTPKITVMQRISFGVNFLPVDYFVRRNETSFGSSFDFFGRDFSRKKYRKTKNEIIVSLTWNIAWPFINLNRQKTERLCLTLLMRKNIIIDKILREVHFLEETYSVEVAERYLYFIEKHSTHLFNR